LIVARVAAQSLTLIQSISVTQAIELAVNIQAQLHQLGQASVSNLFNSSSVIFPACTAQTHSKTLTKSRCFQVLESLPGCIGQPVQITAGRFNLQAAINIQGVILSQLVKPTHQSKL